MFTHAVTPLLLSHMNADDLDKKIIEIYAMNDPDLRKRVVAEQTAKLKSIMNKITNHISMTIRYTQRCCDGKKTSTN